MLSHLENLEKKDFGLLATSILFHLKLDIIKTGHVMDRLVSRIDSDFINWIRLFLDKFTCENFVRFYKAKWVQERMLDFIFFCDF